MRSAPLADVKARLSAYLDECGAEGPWSLRAWQGCCRVAGSFDDEDLERLLLGRSPRFQDLLNRSRKSVEEGKAYPRTISGRRFGNEDRNERRQ
jgi:hypothetical protein